MTMDCTPTVLRGMGLYGATIPAGIAEPGEMIRYRITAGDSPEASARSPLFTDPLDMAEYYGTVVRDPSIQSLLPVMHTFVEDPTSIDRQPGGRASFFFEDKFYDNVEIDPTGRSVGLSGPKKSHDVFFTADNWLEINGGELRMNDFHVITDYYKP